MNNAQSVRAAHHGRGSNAVMIALSIGPALAALASGGIVSAQTPQPPPSDSSAAPASPPAPAQASATVAAVKPAEGNKAAEGKQPPIAASSDRVAAKEAEFLNGSHLHYGLATSLLRFSVTRRANEPAALRDYVPTLESVPADVGFVFMYEPNKSPWRLCKKDGKPFQLLSWGGALFVDPSSARRDQRSISLGLMLGLFENWIALGAGVDLYRGIPTQGSDGESGTGTAYTGLLGWALSSKGEVTPENVFITVALDLSKAVTSATGTVR